MACSLWIETHAEHNPILFIVELCLGLNSSLSGYASGELMHAI